MFGKRDAEKRSFEDIFNSEDGNVSDDLATDDTEVSDDIEAPVKMKPLDCFGMEDGKTEKWLAKCAKIWFCFMSFLWFLFGALTFAPVIFIRNKIDVFFKNKKKSLLFATVIHVLIMTLIVVFCFC